MDSSPPFPLPPLQPCKGIDRGGQLGGLVGTDDIEVAEDAVGDELDPILDEEEEDAVDPHVEGHLTRLDEG